MHVSYRTIRDRRLRIGEREMILPADMSVSGGLHLECSDGPLRTSPNGSPGFVSAHFRFDLNGVPFVWQSDLTMEDLWAPDGTTVIEIDDFLADAGPIFGMMDGRRDWTYVRPDGTAHVTRLKYTPCELELALEESRMLVMCKYYDQHEDIADDIVIHYPLSYDRIMLLPDHEIYLDDKGNAEDVAWRSRSYATVVST